MFGFLLFINSLIPLMMIFFGWLWKDSPPRGINYLYGYRTSMSMKNEDTWRFAHLYHGKIWYWSGLALLVFVLILSLIFRKDYETTSLWLNLIAMAVMILTIIPTEIVLRKKFDKNGKLKEY